MCVHKKLNHYKDIHVKTTSRGWVLLNILHFYNVIAKVKGKMNHYQRCNDYTFVWSTEAWDLLALKKLIYLPFSFGNKKAYCIYDCIEGVLFNCLFNLQLKHTTFVIDLMLYNVKNVYFQLFIPDSSIRWWRWWAQI